MKRMVKDKRHFTELVESNSSRVEKYHDVIEAIKDVLLMYGSSINRVLMSNEIDIALYG